MARMIPDKLRTETKSEAEKRLYALFQVQLPDPWVVFHNVPWQVRDLRNGARDGEADFILAHPDLGILVIEVKGGGISYHGTARQWYSNEYPIKDPFEQAQGNKYSLLHLLHEQPYWNKRYIRIGHAVAFPDITVAQRALRLDAPREIVMDQSHSHTLLAWVQGVFHYWQGQNKGEDLPGQAGINELLLLLSPSITLKPLLSAEFEEEGEQLLQTTQQQFVLLDFLGYHRRAAIRGCAGSGKTLLAVEKARRLSQQGFQVLLTCYNRNLANFLRENLTDYPDIHITHFHGLCRELAQKANLPLPKDEAEKNQAYYDSYLPSLLVEAADILNWRVDAIIVDEGQDLYEEWWLSLQCLLHDPDNGILYVFYDDNKNLYRANQTIPLEIAPFPLTINCRNTQTIYTFVNQFYQADHLTSVLGPKGREIEILRYPGKNELKKHLRRTLHHLISEEGVWAEDIVVLTPRSRENSVLWGLGALGNYQLVDRPTGASGDIFCTTIHQFKGLESPVVILTELEYAGQQPDIKRLLYTGGSRACNQLILIVHEAFEIVSV